MINDLLLSLTKAMKQEKRMSAINSRKDEAKTSLIVENMIAHLK